MTESFEPWHQLWATFSVKDHCSRGAFTAEVLLYDKLVIPVVPTQEDGLDADSAKKQWDRWVEKKWDPKRQEELVKILGDSAELIAWTGDLEDEWQAKMNSYFASSRRDGYFMTGSVLEKFSPAMAKTIVAVSQYRSLLDLGQAGIRRRRPDELLPSNSLLAVLGYELLLPDDPDQNEFDVLRRAVAEAQKNEYRTRRRALFEWQQKFLRSGSVTDATSIREAVKEMTQLVDQLKTATSEQKKWKWAKRFFSFLGIAAKGVALAPPLTVVGSAGGAIASLGTFAVDEVSQKGGLMNPAVPAATLVLNAQETLGIE